MATLDDQSTEEATAASAEAPVGTAQVDIAGIVQQAVTAAMEQQETRFKGFQSLIDKKLGAFSNELKTARLSPEEQAQLESEGEEDEVDAMRQKLALYEMRDQFPRGVERLLKLAGAESLEDQLALMEALEDPKVAAQVAEAVANSEAAETPVPEVDPNNPARPTTEGSQSAMSGSITSEEQADAVLKAFGG